MSDLVWCHCPVQERIKAEIAQLVEHDLAKVGVGSSSLLFRSNLARWQSGHVADCNSVYAGSIPTRASIYPCLSQGRWLQASTARVVKSVDTRDLKSLAGNSVPVQVRPRAPTKSISYVKPSPPSFSCFDFGCQLVANCALQRCAASSLPNRAEIQVSVIMLCL